MVKINANYLELQGSYLFSTIAKKVREFTAANPDKKIIRLGIGDVTRPLTPTIIKALHEQGADDIIVFVGGVIPRQDYDFLYEAGVKGIYGPGTPIPVSAKDVLEQIRKARHG